MLGKLVLEKVVHGTWELVLGAWDATAVLGRLFAVLGSSKRYSGAKCGAQELTRGTQEIDPRESGARCSGAGFHPWEMVFRSWCSTSVLGAHPQVCTHHILSITYKSFFLSVLFNHTRNGFSITYSILV